MQIYSDGVMDLISISFSCGTELFTIQWRDPESGWSLKALHSALFHHNIPSDLNVGC